MREQVPPRINDQHYLERYRAAWEDEPSPAARWQAFLERPDRPPVRFAFQASAVYSSNIEGNTIDLNSYLRSKTRGTPLPRTKEQAEIDALVDAYAFARRHVPNERNMLKAHHMLTRDLLGEPERGHYRTGRMFVYDSQGIIYAAAEPEHVPGLIQRFFADLTTLRRAALDVDAVFYHAALLHLVFVHIHPFEDGNGRTARLLEKWFLAAHLGTPAWTVPSEAYYWRHRPDYYQALRLGPNYYYLDYDQCLPFLTLLPRALDATL
jgi:Fic family protein